MDLSSDMSGEILEISLTAKRPVRDLMKIADRFAGNNDTEGLYDIDVALTGLFVDYIRKGTGDEFDALTDDLYAFLDSAKGDRLKSFKEGEKYFVRWEYLIDFTRIVLEKYDPDMTARFIASRKHGKKLMQLLLENYDGIRVKDLAEELGISNQQLAKLLREFEDHDLIIREKVKKMTLVHLDFMGRVYMSEKEEPPASGIMESSEIETLKQRWAANPFPDEYHDFPLKRGFEAVK